MKGHAYLSVLALLAGGLLALSLVGLVLARSNGIPGSSPPASIGDDEDWSVALDFFVVSGSVISGEPSVTFGVRPSCTDAFEITCDVPRNKLLPQTQLQVFFDNPLGGDNPSEFVFDIELLQVSLQDPGDGDLTSKTWTLNVNLGGGVSVAPGNYTVFFEWVSEDVDAIPNDPPREVVLLDDQGTQLVDFRTGTASGGATCNAVTDGHSCSLTLAASSSVIKDYTVRVAEAGATTTARILGPNEGDEGEIIQFDGTTSSPGDGATLTNYRWTVDGQQVANGSTETDLDHAFPDEGDFTVGLTVTDNRSGSNSTTHAVTINNVAPTITSVTANPETVNEGETSTITINATDVSVDVPDLLFSFDCNGNGEFDDPGDAEDQPDNEFDCLFPDNSTHTVFVGVTDDAANPMTEDSIDVEVNNVNPEITSVVAVPTTINEGGSSTITVNATDVTTDPLQYSFDCDDNNVFEVGPQNGNSTECDFPNSSDHDVNVLVEDDDGGETAGSTTVTVNNVNPVIDSITANPTTVNEGGSSTITVNASDVGGDMLLFFIDCNDDSDFDDAVLGDVELSSINETDCVFPDGSVHTVNVLVQEDPDFLAIAEGSVDVQVNDVAPTVDDPQDLIVQSEVRADLETGFTHPGFDCPQCDPPTEETFTATIDWGEGAGPEETQVVIDISGSPGVLTEGTVSGNHRYAADGLYEAQVCVREDEGEEGCADFTVIIGAAVELLLDPSTVSPQKDADFNVTLRVNPNGTPVDGVQAVMSFDWRIEVVGPIVVDDTGLPNVTCEFTQPEGTTDGTIECAATGPTATAEVFNIAVITFNAANIGPASINFEDGTQATKDDAPVLKSPVVFPALGSQVNVQGEVGVELTVSLEAVPLESDNVRFDVILLPGGTLDNNSDTPWDAVSVAPLATFADVVGTPDDGDGRLFELLLSGVDTDLYDIAIVAKRDGGLLPTLTNLNPNVNVDRPVEDLEGHTSTDMDVLREGNVVNDLRALEDPDIEPQPIINALDTSALIAAFGTSEGESGFNAAADFNRDGNIDIDDLNILTNSYLLFSPVVVVGP